jgi:hypothetical protein
MVLSAFAATAGAVMYWAVAYQGSGFRLSTVGLILMIVGAFGFVVSTIVFAVSRNPVGAKRHQMNRQVVDTRGNTSSVHEDSRSNRTPRIQFPERGIRSEVVRARNYGSHISRQKPTLQYGKEY